MQGQLFRPKHSNLRNPQDWHSINLNSICGECERKIILNGYTHCDVFSADKTDFLALYFYKTYVLKTDNRCKRKSVKQGWTEMLFAKGKKQEPLLFNKIYGFSHWVYIFKLKHSI